LFSQFNDAVIDHEEIKEFVAEPWFILLLAGVITLMVILLAAVLFVRYRQLGAKKSHLGGNYVFGIFFSIAVMHAFWKIDYNHTSV